MQVWGGVTEKSKYTNLLEYKLEYSPSSRERIQSDQERAHTVSVNTSPLAQR